ncbi:MAG: T9SS type A sorting domain-containing protein [Bacteroidota bacterium]
MIRLYATLLALALVAPTASGQNLNSVVEAYVWGNQPTAASYTPSPTFSYNVSGEANTATRTDVGRYTITLNGIPDLRNGNRGNVQISSYGSNAVCVTGGWDSDPRQIRVICRDPATDTPVDSRYTVLYTRASGASPDVAYTFPNRTDGSSHTPNTLVSNTPGGGTISAYTLGSASEIAVIEFPGFSTSTANDDSGHLQLTAGGTTSTGGAARCSAGGFTTFTNGVLATNTFCAGANAAPLFARYSALYLRAGSSNGGPAFAYVHANNATAASYTPSSNRTFSQNGGAVRPARTGTGVYTMTFEGLGGRGVSGGHAQVTAFSQTGGYCTIRSWGSGTDDVLVNVDCFDASGAPADQEYLLLFSWPNNVVNAVSAEAGPNDAALALSVAGPNPTADRTAFDISLAQAGVVRVAVVDLLGREVTVLADGPLGAGTTRLDLDASALPAGVYIARLVAAGQARTLRFTVVH